MTRICWLLVDILSRMLEPDDQEAVRGDVAESCETSGQALNDVLGLVLRRQAALWKALQPWLVLVVLVVPLALLLGRFSSGVAGMSAEDSWVYLDNWDWDLLQLHAFWLILAENAWLLLQYALALTCMSWTVGLMIASLARRTLPVNGTLFCLLLLFEEFLVVPRDLRLQMHWLQIMVARDHPNASSSWLAFYPLIFPPLVQIALVLLPSLWGMYQGFGRGPFPPAARAFVWASGLAPMVLLASGQELSGITRANHNWIGLWPGFHIPILLFSIAGPVVYVANARWRRWRCTKPVLG